MLCREQIGQGEALRREAGLESTAMVQAEGTRAVTKAEVGWKGLRGTVEVKTHRARLIRRRREMMKKTDAQFSGMRPGTPPAPL